MVVTDDAVDLRTRQVQGSGEVPDGILTDVSEVFRKRVEDLHEHFGPRIVCRDDLVRRLAVKAGCRHEVIRSSPE